MDVYLVRHAIAANRDATRWPDDAERPLTPEGAARFRRAADGLRRLGPGIDRVFSSPYRRAVQTAEILEDVTGWPRAEHSDVLAATTEPAAAAEFLAGLDPQLSVALVGHEPFLSSLASLLLTRDEGVVRLELKKGGVVYLASPGECVSGAAVLRWHLTPKLLRRLAA